MSMNKQRRQVLKTITALTASSAVVVATPSIVSAASFSSQIAATAAAATPATALDSAGVRVTLSSVGKQTFVTVTNTLTTPVTLTQVYPGTVSDASGIFDLNSLLAAGPKTVMPGKPWVSKIYAAQATRLNTPSMPKSTQGVKITVATHNATPSGYKLVETTRFLRA